MGVGLRVCPFFRLEVCRDQEAAGISTGFLKSFSNSSRGLPLGAAGLCCGTLRSTLNCSGVSSGRFLGSSDNGIDFGSSGAAAAA